MTLVSPLRFARDLPIFEKEVPFELFGYPTPTSDRITNVEFEMKDGIKIADVRGLVQKPSLDTTGFQFIKHKSRCPLEVKYFEQPGSDIERNPVVLDYLDESVELVKSVFGTKKVVCFDWRFRRAGAPPDVIPDSDDIYTIRFQAVAPGLDIHCDFSEKGGAERLAMHLLQEELDAVKKGTLKAKIVNVWRPIHVVKNTPLVLADRRSVKKDDLFEVEKVIPDKVERAYYLTYQEHHDFYYMSNMEPDDVAIFMTWQPSGGGETADYPPHGAASQFDDDWATSPRESLEVRLIVFSIED